MKGHENNGDDHHLKKLLLVIKQIILTHPPRKLKGNSMENLLPDVRIERVNLLAPKE